MMPSSATLPNGTDDGPRVRGFSLLFGALLGLALLKFGNPVIMEHYVTMPENRYQWLINPWPVVVGYGLLAVVGIVAFVVARWQFGRRPWLAALPAAWLVWQFISATQTVDVELTRVTLEHFVACAACFYLGLFCLNREGAATFFLWPVAAAFALVIAVGLNQHFGGLRETREFFFTYIYPTMKDVPPEYLKRISSERIFSTLFYPNTLAGVFLLLLPASLAAVLGTPRLTIPARGFVAAVLAGGAGACLYWSGSKAGWLLMLGLLVVALLRLPLGRGVKVGIVCGLIIAGMAGFAWKYASFFQRGATSVVARFDYWRAALQTAAEKPFCGSGPGTFSRAYERIKKPESEMARLTHNDYLQQASDSGWPGFVLYAVFVGGVLLVAGQRAVLDTDWMRFAVWLGVLGWSAQNCVEFGLYIPALAWPGFALMGWLVANESQPHEVREGNEREPWQGFAACAAFTRHRPQNDSTTKPPPASVRAKK